MIVRGTGQAIKTRCPRAGSILKSRAVQARKDASCLGMPTKIRSTVWEGRSWREGQSGLAAVRPAGGGRGTP